MGWATGSGIAEELWRKFKEYIPAEYYKELSRDILETFESYDADDWDYYDEEGLYCTYKKLNLGDDDE